MVRVVVAPTPVMVVVVVALVDPRIGPMVQVVAEQVDIVVAGALAGSLEALLGNASPPRVRRVKPAVVAAAEVEVLLLVNTWPAAWALVAVAE
jgi:hypothetical protein